MEYLQVLQSKVVFSTDVSKRLYSIISDRDYSILYLNTRSGMSRGKIAEIKDIEEEPYLEFFEHNASIPKEAIYFDLKNIRYENREGKIVIGDARIYKTSNRHIGLLEE
ncbi:MAG: hypothetical protein ACI85O_003477 [Saprospiraceae bacterium]|jgi:hypothetical protein